jgi:coenzyme F420 hydrogenase subunit beta
MPHGEKPGFQDIDARVCTQCGTCVSICPVHAIVADANGVRLQGECIECGLCYDFCPGREMDFTALSAVHLGSVPNDPLLGHYRRLSVARAQSAEVRQQGSSGGVVTALLLHLLETKEIRGALGVTTDLERPWKPRPALLTERVEIMAAAQSKYSLVSVAAMLRTARREPGPFAVVGLPCHVHGLRRLQRLGSYRTQFPLTIGLFCGFNLLPTATDHLIAKIGLHKEQIVNLQYRGGPWPGGLLVQTSDGQQRFIPKHLYGYVNLAYSPRRCLTCPDLTNELADLSVGDCWLEQYSGGWSTVICRSVRGERLLKAAEQAGVLSVEDISREDLLRSHGHLLAYKKEGYFVRQKWLSLPLRYKLLRPEISARRQLGQSVLLLLILGLGSRPARAVLRRVPLSWLAWLSDRGRQAVAHDEAWQSG